LEVVIRSAKPLPSSWPYQFNSALQNAAQLEAFFLAMTLYPDVQAAAQKEIAQVVGNDRLPDISDRSHLPYVNALCKEVIRWHVAVPLGNIRFFVYKLHAPDR
jgi:hypothetical protein